MTVVRQSPGAKVAQPAFRLCLHLFLNVPGPQDAVARILNQDPKDEILNWLNEQDREKLGSVSVMCIQHQDLPSTCCL